MDGLEKPAPPVEDTSEGYLYRQYLAAKPRFKSKEEAIATLSAELEAIEKRVGLSAWEMFNRCENFGDTNEDYREACSLHARIFSLKKK